MIPVQRQAKFLKVGDRIRMEIGTRDFREVGWWTVHTLDQRIEDEWWMVVVDGNIEFLPEDLVTVLVRPAEMVRVPENPVEIPTDDSVPND